MFKLHVVQADKGDCFIVEFGSQQQPRYALIDGGPGTIYQDHLRSELQKIQAAGRCLDFVALSHVDDDHVNGLLDLTSELCKQKEKQKPLTITINALLHNTFSQTVGADVEDGYVAWMGENPGKEQRIFEVDPSEKSIRQGDKLTTSAEKLGIRINPGLEEGQPIYVGGEKTAFTFDNLTLHIAGPNQKNMEKLRADWLDWLDKQNSKDLSAPSDDSPPNLSSLMFLAEADGKTILFTGDGRADDLLAGLKLAGLTDAQGCLHVDILKLPHHGSLRNVYADFFKTITADRYVISADGQDGNPDLDTLKWIVEAARDQGRKIELFVTNQTQSTADLLSQCPSEQYGYRLVGMDGENAHTITLESS